MRRRELVTVSTDWIVRATIGMALLGMLAGGLIVTLAYERPFT